MSEPADDRGLEALLEYLRDTRGFDFTGYKRASLARRIGKRMQAVGMGSYTDYLDYLQVHPDEVVELFNFILINVTAFFREPEVWDYVSDQILPRIVQSKPAGSPIRVWCAGVASGEEAYSVAMLIAERLGESGFHEHVKIYATDVDQDALATARQGVYTAKQVEPIPKRLLDRYFKPVGTSYVFDKDLRRSVIFGRHDLVQDAPISRIDLLICRNTLMYFNAETQARILEHFRFALNQGGFLVLGKAEMLFTDLRAFTPVDLKRRVFIRGPQDMALLGGRALQSEEGGSPLTNQALSRDAALEFGPLPQLVVDRNGYLRMANEKARELFGLRGADIGRPFRDLEVSYQPVELRSHIEQVTTSRQPEFLPEVVWSRRPGQATHLQIELVPLLDGEGYLGTVITFQDVTAYRDLQEKLERSNQELETALEELQSTNEELETTNEELQSTNEELETTNEELQSTNEELETMNEELQATNEELQAANDELVGQGEQLKEANTFLGSVLSSVDSGIAVLDDELRIRVWNDRAQDLWGLRPEEVEGRSFLDLDIGLPVAELASGLRTCLDDGASPYKIELEAVNRRGRAITCAVTCTPRTGPEGEGRRVTIAMEQLEREG